MAIIDEIEAIRNGATGISTGTLWEHAEEYPELAELAKKGIETESLIPEEWEGGI